MARRRLTDKFVRCVKTPGRYGDGGRGSFGLSLLVKSAKRGGLIKNWQQRYRKDGKYTSRGLGTYPDVSLEQARKLAAHYVVEGKPPTDDQMADLMSAVRQAISAVAVSPPATATVEVSLERHPDSFRRLFLESLEKRAKTFKAGSKTEKQAKSLFESYIPRELADRPISEVEAIDLIDCLEEVWREKPSTASKLVQHITPAFHRAMVRDLIDFDPMTKARLGLGPLKQKNRTHQRALRHSEVGAALTTVWGTDAQIASKLALTFLTLTAGRSGEVRGATWDEIDLENRVWTLSAARMKEEREHRVPLSDAALDVLRQASELRDDSGLVFPSVRGRQLSDNTLSKLMRENGINGTPHGMRSSFSDWAGEMTDFPKEISEHGLSHIEGSATFRAYRRTDYFEKRRQMMSEWAAYIDSTR